MGGSNDPSNKTTLCAGHHIAGQHEGRIDIGGLAPHQLTTKLGIHPRTGRALACFFNERRISAQQAEAHLAQWRASWRYRNGSEGGRSVA